MLEYLDARDSSGLSDAQQLRLINASLKLLICSQIIAFFARMLSIRGYPTLTVSSLAEGVGENALGGGEKFTSRDCAKFGAAANFTPQKRDGKGESLGRCTYDILKILDSFTCLCC